MRAFDVYLDAVQKTLSSGYASERSHYRSLQNLLESLENGITATSEPARIECGAPDFIVTKGSAIRGYVEAKDIGKSLDDAEKTDQLKRYLPSLSNLILTDCLEFRWYVDGECRLKAGLGSLTKDGKTKRDRDGIQAVAELLTNFLAHRAESVGTPRDLARRMARQAHLIRNLIVSAFEKESEGGSLHSQLAAFRDTLIPDLSADRFADMYAQTIVYGLFAARCTHIRGKDFTRQNAAYLIPKTNPFLRKLFNQIAGPELDPRIAWLVDDLAQVLAQADMDAVLEDFGRRTAKEDPVVHFYETFLKEYDQKIREVRGVYYTPEPVVSYIVRSVDHLLKTGFGTPLGLADPAACILDPAVGTATFLYRVIEEIHQAIIRRGQKGLWNDYVAAKLLPRVFGFELLMGPYTVAHLKLGLLLRQTGYQFETDQRLGVYLTNTLGEALEKSEQLAGFNEYIVEEANAAAEIKKTKPIMVVLGNPPYKGYSANPGEWVDRLIDDYRWVDGKPLTERKVWLQNDYVKFMRFGQWRVERTGQGILAFVTDHSYLDSPTFRGMRQSLANTFNEIYILDLHGDTRRRKPAPDGGKDENVFDIQEGVSIGIFVKRLAGATPARVYHAELWGPRGDWPDPKPGTKYRTLSEVDVAAIQWHEIKPSSRFHVFVPRDDSLLSEYQRGWKLTDIFPVRSTGIQTSRDRLVIGFEPSELLSRILVFRDWNVTDLEIAERFGVKNTREWEIPSARRTLAADEGWQKRIRQCLYRPFDMRSIYYSPQMVDWPRLDVMRHMLHDNRALCVGRAGQVVGEIQWDVVFCSNSLVDLNLFRRGGNVTYPLYLYSSRGELLFQEGQRHPNLNLDFTNAVTDKLGLEFALDGNGGPKQAFTPEDAFNYAYAVFHSPSYRIRYAELLKDDFPRLPLTSDRELFKALVAKGAALVALHIMESPTIDNLITNYPSAGTNSVNQVTYDVDSQRVYVNKTQYFEGVPREVWEFRIGGYQVCKRWLEERRKGRTLTYDDLIHYQRVIVALKETIRLMAEIDELIPMWPLE